VDLEKVVLTVKNQSLHFPGLTVRKRSDNDLTLCANIPLIEILARGLQGVRSLTQGHVF